MQNFRSYTLIIVGLFLCNFLNIDALVFTVTSTANAGAGTLRMAITDLNAGGDPAGNIIAFDLPGPTVIALTSPLPAITKQVTIDGLEINSGNKVTINGFLFTGASLFAGLHFTTNDASNSTATNLIIQNFTNTDDDGSAYGILCDDNANNCSVTNCLISSITSGGNLSGGPINAEAMGIKSFNSMNMIINNEINSIISSPFNDTGNAAGIYVEDTIIGECNDNLINTITSGDADSMSGISGFVYGIFADTLNRVCLDNIIADLTSGSGSQSGDVNGIQITTKCAQQCSNNIIALLTSGDTLNSFSGTTTGIFIGTAKNIDNNIISQITSGGSNTSDSGNAIGIITFATETINQNSTSDIITGNSTNGTSGTANGITVELLSQTCNANLLNKLTAGVALTQGSSLGISIINALTGASIINNSISNITGIGGISNIGVPTVGLYLLKSNRPSIENNSFTSIIGIGGEAHGIILGCIANCGTGPLQQVTNGNIFNNTISNITGSMSNGFGISIEEGSKGNDILYTSIFNINGKAINIVDNNAPIDAVVTLEKIECCLQRNTFAVTGTLEPAANLVTKQFLIQLFVSTLDAPPQIESFIGEFIIQAFGNPTQFCETITLASVTIEEGQFITATATAINNINNNTSEVSNVIVVPNCTPQNICEVIGRPPLIPPDFNTLCGFISINRKTP